MPARRAHPEKDFDRQIFEAFNLMLPESAIAFKIANEDRAGRPSPGVVKGMPDWCVIQALDDTSQAFGGPGFCRVVMPELKARSRKPSDDQERVMTHLRERCNVVTGPCWTLDEVLALCEAGGIRLKGRIA